MYVPRVVFAGVVHVFVHLTHLEGKLVAQRRVLRADTC